VHNNSSIAQLSLIGHHCIHLTRVAARDYAAVFAKGFGAFVNRGHTFKTLLAVENKFHRDTVHLSTAPYIRVFIVLINTLRFVRIRSLPTLITSVFGKIL
jgi:hypothetical protein